jgi:putative flippase GtrA
VRAWSDFKARHPSIAQFLVFFALSNGVTLLQMLMLPLFKLALGATSLIEVNFQFGQIGYNFDRTPYYIFNYASGALADGGGGGLAYFLSVQLAMGMAQVINFFAQRNITFRSNGKVLRAAMWYFIAYVIITVGAAALQGIYKAPIYELLINAWSLGAFGEALADVLTMLINSAISFWVFFPIFKVIFKSGKRG